MTEPLPGLPAAAAASSTSPINGRNVRSTPAQNTLPTQPAIQPKGTAATSTPPSGQVSAQNQLQVPPTGRGTDHSSNLHAQSKPTLSSPSGQVSAQNQNQVSPTGREVDPSSDSTGVTISATPQQPEHITIQTPEAHGIEKSRQPRQPGLPRTRSGVSFRERLVAGRTNTNNSETEPASNNQITPQPVIIASPRQVFIPTLKPQHFYHHDWETGKSSVDVVVVFMHGGAEDDSRYSIFVYDEKLESSDVPKSTPKEDAIKPGNAKALDIMENSDGDGIRAEIKALEAENEPLQAKNRVGRELLRQRLHRVIRASEGDSGIYERMHGRIISYESDPKPLSSPSKSWKNVAGDSGAISSTAPSTKWPTGFEEEVRAIVSNPEGRIDLGDITPDILTKLSPKLREQYESVKLEAPNEVPNKAQQSLPSNAASPQPKPAPLKRINWLEDKDMLPGVIPEGRILGFGFDLSTVNAPIDFDSTAANLLDILVKIRGGTSTKPIVFIGHGYGSVVIESLLSRSDDKGTPSSQLRASTTSVILFAALFLGSTDLIKWSEKEMKLPKSTDLAFTGLGNNSGKLQKIWNDFVVHARDPDIFISLYREKGPTADSTEAEDKVVQELAKEGVFVEQTSADIGQIARFSGPKDREFLILTGRILTGIQTWQLLGAAEGGDKDSLKVMMGHSIDINLVSKTEQTALHVSARYGKLEFMKILLGNRKADIDHKDNLGNTALHIAVQGNKREMVEELLKAGADPDIKNFQKQKPKHLPNTEIGILNLLKKRPLVEGPLAQTQKELNKSQPPRGAGIEACKSTEMVATEMFLIEGKENPEQHLTIYRSIYDLIYTETVVEKMLGSERSADITQEPHCRWYHIPANNMAWVEDLLAKLDIQINPWPSRHRDGEFPHSRCMNPVASNLHNLDPATNKQRNALAIFMPYISYEEITRQQKLNEMIEKIYKEHKEQEKDPEIRDADQVVFRYSRNFARPGSRKKSRGEEGGDVIGDDADHTPGLPTSPRIITANAEEINQNSAEDEQLEQHTEKIGAEGATDPTANDSIAAYQPKEAEMSDDSDSDSDSDNDSETDEMDQDVQLQITAYLNHNPPLHPRRTLDQSYYYMLSTTSDRDSDQVVSRRAKKEYRRAPEREPKNYEGHNILMVDQLWIWYIKARNSSEPDTVITSFPSREGVKVEKSRDMDDLQTEILKNQGQHSREVISSATDLITRIMNVCCRTLDRHQHVKPLQFVQMFQSTIGDAEAEETQLLVEFRRITEELYNLHEKHPKYQELRRDKLKDLLNIRSESKLLKDIKDVLDEIKMIKAILKDQLGVLESSALPKFFPDSYRILNPYTNEREQGPFSEVKKLLEGVDHDFDVMENHAKDVERGVNHLMDLKQMQANLWEARSSREGAEETAKQGNTILVFTIVTIVFLPLSFMASFFALGVAQFPKDENGNTQWPLHYISGLLFGISFAVSIPLLFFAFNVNLLTTPWNYFRFILLRIFAMWLIQPLRHVPIMSVRIKGYNWHLKLDDGLYAYGRAANVTLPKDKRRRRRSRWIEGIRWNLEGSGIWTFKDIKSFFDPRTLIDEDEE